LEETIVEIKARYKDLDLNFLPHPVTHDISPLVDDRAVKNSVKSLVLTNQYERPYQPEVFSNVMRSLFDNILPHTAMEIQANIERVISSYEPRAQDLEVIVKDDPDNNQYAVNIQFTIDGYIDVFATTIFLERVR
jgi:phage baseplate assembly protein W